METFSTFSDTKPREFSRIECTRDHIIYHCMKSKNNILLYREFHRACLFLYKQQKNCLWLKLRVCYFHERIPWMLSRKTEEGDEGSFGALPSFPLSCTILPRLFKLSTVPDKSLRSEWAAQENQLRYPLDSDFKSLSSGLFVFLNT